MGHKLQKPREGKTTASASKRDSVYWNGGRTIGDSKVEFSKSACIPFITLYEKLEKDRSIDSLGSL